MADQQDQPPKQPFNLFNLFSAFKPPTKPAEHEATSSSDTRNKPATVRFPRTQPVVAPTVAAEVEEPITKSSNPIVVWQVYALGGFLVLKWIWGRWQERNRDPNEEDGKEEASSDDE